MSPTVARVLLSLAAFIGAIPAYLAVFALLERLVVHSNDFALVCTDAVVAGLFVLAWIRIWGPEVRWTRKRALTTLYVTAASVLVSVGISVALGMTIPYFGEVAIILGGFVWWALWIAATAWVWCETPAERVARASVAGGLDLHCPKCNYDLRGLHEARCPECGAAYTLDGLFAACLERRAVLDVEERSGSHGAAGTP